MGKIAGKVSFVGWDDLYVDERHPERRSVYDLEDMYVAWLNEHPTAEIVKFKKHKDDVSVEWVIIYREEE